MARESEKEELKRKDIAHVLHGQVVPSVFHKSGCTFYEKAYGVRVVDMDGKEYLDGMCAGICANIGYGREDVAEVAKEQMIKLQHYSNFNYLANIPEIELCAKLAEIAPAKIERFMTQNSGSDAVEAAVKTARFYWKEKEGKDKFKIISLDKSYHGTTAGAISATGNTFWLHPNSVPFASGFVHIKALPYCYRCLWGKSYPGCNLECAQTLEEAIEREGEDTVAAFLSEPMWVASGVHVAPPEYWQKMTEICKKHNVLLIIDEVITGFGRNGKLWCSQIYDLKPDILTFAKGLAAAYMPMAGVGITDEIYKGITANDAIFPQVHTFGGHAVGCAVALKTIEITLREKLPENAAKMGKYMLERLAPLKKESPYVGDVRGLGMTTGVELVADKDTKEPLSVAKTAEVVANCYEKGVIVVAFGDNILRWGLPLTATKEDIDIILDTVEWAIKGIQA